MILLHTLSKAFQWRKEYYWDIFPYRLPFKLVSATRALLGSTQLMLFKLGIYEIRTAYRTQVADLTHLVTCACVCYLSWSNQMPSNILLQLPFYRTVHHLACPSFCSILQENPRPNSDPSKHEILQNDQRRKQKQRYITWFKHVSGKQIPVNICVLRN